jgi:hypothetical protein
MDMDDTKVVDAEASASCTHVSIGTDAHSNTIVNNRSISSGLGRWNVFGNTIPKEEIVFFSQVVLIYIVAITCIVNLSLKLENSNLWTSLLSASLGYMLPAPNLGNRK